MLNKVNVALVVHLPVIALKSIITLPIHYGFKTFDELTDTGR